jgi:hypothetical protein
MSGNKAKGVPPPIGGGGRRSQPEHDTGADSGRIEGRSRDRSAGAWFSSILSFMAGSHPDMALPCSRALARNPYNRRGKAHGASVPLSGRRDSHAFVDMIQWSQRGRSCGCLASP